MGLSPGISGDLSGAHFTSGARLIACLLASVLVASGHAQTTTSGIAVDGRVLCGCLSDP